MEIINKYLPVIEQWKEPYFVTLTARAVPACKHKSRMERMSLSLKKILARNKKRHQRGTGIKLELIHALECNFNPIRRTYNPHFHLLVSTKAGAELIIEDWLKACIKEFASPAAQNMRPVRDTVHDLVEVVKYGSKIFTDPTMQKGRTKATPYVYVAAFHNIICALEGYRVFERFGFNVPAQAKTAEHTMIKEYQNLIFDSYEFDWVNQETSGLLSNYKPTKEFISILNDNVNTILN